jgi:hypothetical protein
VKNAFQPVTKSQNCADGGGDTFVTRINTAGTDLDYSTYLNGTFESIGRGIAVDSTFHAYVTGSTESSDFPTTPGAFQTTFLAKTIPSFPHDIPGHNAYITKFAVDGRSLVYSTFLGGTVSDDAAAIALDDSGRAYVTGTTQSKDFPVTSGAFQKSLRGTADAFVTKMQISGGGLFYSTFLGGSGEDGEDNDDEEDENKGAERSEGGLAAAPAPGTLDVCHWAREDWFIAKQTREVVGEFLRSAITLGWLFLQTFQTNRFQIARHTGVEHPW